MYLMAPDLNHYNLTIESFFRFVNVALSIEAKQQNLNFHFLKQ